MGKYYPLEMLHADYRGLCHLCGEHVPLRLATRDHIVPAAEPNGYHKRKNIALAHISCNEKRGNLSIAQFQHFRAMRPFINGHYRWTGTINKQLAAAQQAALLRQRERHARRVRSG